MNVSRILNLFFAIACFTNCGDLGFFLRNFKQVPFDSDSSGNTIITVQYPRKNKRVGYLIPSMKGKCGQPGFVVSVEHENGSVLATTICNAGSSWATPVDVSSLTVGFHNLKVVHKTTHEIGVVMHPIFKVHKDCDDPMNRLPFTLIGTGFGNGGTPILVVCTREQLPLASLGEGLNIRLGNDLDYSNTKATTFVPLDLHNNFDGDFFTIMNIHIKRPNSDGVGLFSLLESPAAQTLHIHNIEFENPVIWGRDRVGVVAGYGRTKDKESQLIISNITITDATVNGRERIGGIIGEVSTGTGTSIFGNAQLSQLKMVADLHSEAGDAGGIVGKMIGGVIRQVSYSGSISSSHTAGGIVGDAEQLRIRESSSRAIIIGSSTSFQMGGLIGSFQSVDSESEMRDLACLGGGVVSGGDYSGGLIGKLSGNLFTVESSYTLCQVHRVVGSQGTFFGEVTGKNGVAGIDLSKVIYAQELPVWDDDSNAAFDGASSLGLELPIAEFALEKSFPKSFDFVTLWTLSGLPAPELRWESN